MAAISFDPNPHLQPPQSQQQFQPISTCEQHPDQNVTGFCASCLRERLAGLDTAATRHVKPPSSGALKSIFFRLPANHPNSHHASSSFLSELRRCKSFSGRRVDGGAASLFEPQRKSCDVRARGTLWSLFHLDDDEVPRDHHLNPFFPPSTSAFSVAAGAGGEIEIECRNVCVIKSRVEEGEEEEEEEEEDILEEEEKVAERGRRNEIDAGTDAICVEEQEEEDVRPMKDHIDLDAVQNQKLPPPPPPPPPKDLKEIAGSFWLAASVFSKKLQKWRRKQKLKKQTSIKAAGVAAAAVAEKNPFRSRRRRGFTGETQSEIIADEVFGRRSCDTDPRFSLDFGRISFDDPRYSFDEPRASWDGHLIPAAAAAGRSSVPFPRPPPMLSVLEDAAPRHPITTVVQRSDGQIPVEEDSTTPGGSAQTRDYYSDSSSQRRRRSLDRSSSVRRSSAEIDDPNKQASNAMATDYFPHVNKLDGVLKDSNFFCSESFNSAYREPRKGATPKKKSRRWSKAWSLWGFIHRRSHGRGVGVNVVERSFSETWPELQREGYNGNGKVCRSNSSVSSRHSFHSNGGFGSMRRNGLEINGYGKKRREEFVLERNRSTRYSPSHIDNGLLRFYLTPLRSSRRGHGSGKGHHKSSHSFARSVLRLY